MKILEIFFAKSTVICRDIQDNKFLTNIFNHAAKIKKRVFKIWTKKLKMLKNFKNFDISEKNSIEIDFPQFLQNIFWDFCPFSESKYIHL